MKISIKQLVMVFLGLFLLKIAVADPYRSTKSRGPASIDHSPKSMAFGHTR